VAVIGTCGIFPKQVLQKEGFSVSSNNQKLTDSWNIVLLNEHFLLVRSPSFAL
jgi:hypothetical protein